MESQHALHVALGGVLDLLAYGLVVGPLLQHGRQVHHAHVGRRNPERHPGELPVQRRDDLPHRLGRAGAAGDDVVARGPAPSPVLLGRPVDRLLRGGHGVDGGHERLLDPELVVDHLGQRGQAVGGAAGVGHDVHVVLVLVVVDAHDEHGRVGRGGGDDHLLGPAVEVHAGLLGGGEDSRGLDDVVGAGVAPGDLGRVHLAEDLDGLAVDGDGLGLLVVGDGLAAATVDGVVLVHVLHVIHRDERIVDGDDVHVGLVRRRAHHQASDAPEAVDSDIDGHGWCVCCRRIDASIENEVIWQLARP
mmetsp:Transcript_1181/g.2551  ORF Transcript_1181/g.2551 Transcript_1181/m.2551 type:complete len:303 (+) Transcript_1181:346-1254(+)